MSYNYVTKLPSANSAIGQLFKVFVFLRNDATASHLQFNGCRLCHNGDEVLNCDKLRIDDLFITKAYVDTSPLDMV